MARGSYRPYTGADFKGLLDATNRDAQDVSAPSSELMDEIGLYIQGNAPPSELIIAAHRDGISASGLDGLLKQAGYTGGSIAQADDGGNSGDGYDVPPPQAAKIKSLEQSKEATAELAEGKAELAEEKSELAEEAEDPGAAKKAEDAAGAALEKGKKAIKGKAKTAGKIAAGTAIGQAMTNIEKATGGSASYDTSGLNVQGAQPAVSAGDTAQDMKDRAGDAFDESLKKQKQSQEKATTSLGNWGGR